MSAFPQFPNEMSLLIFSYTTPHDVWASFRRCSKDSYEWMTRYCCKLLVHKKTDDDLESKNFKLTHQFILRSIKNEEDVTKCIKFFSEHQTGNFQLRFSFIKQHQPVIKLAKPTVDFLLIQDHSPELKVYDFILTDVFAPKHTQSNFSFSSNLGRYDLNYFNTKNIPLCTRKVNQLRTEFIKKRLNKTPDTKIRVFLKEYFKLSSSTPLSQTKFESRRIKHNAFCEDMMKFVLNEIAKTPHELLINPVCWRPPSGVPADIGILLRTYESKFGSRDPLIGAQKWISSVPITDLRIPSLKAIRGASREDDALLSEKPIPEEAQTSPLPKKKQPVF